MKKKTHEEYVNELATKNPTVKVIDEYINTNTKIMHYCLKHDVYWETTPARVLKGSGCEMCKKERFRKSKCKTHEKFIEEANNVNPDIEIIGKYIDSKTPIKCYCKKHNVFWDTLPDNILNGSGCIMCGKEKIGNKNRKSHEQYIEDLKVINPNIVVIGKYVSSDVPILHKCLKDGYEWYARPGNILFGKRCPKCVGGIKKTQEEYTEKLSSINPNIEVLEEYINAYTPILHRCKLHNINWKTSPSSALQGSGCGECGKERQTAKTRKTHNHYVKDLKKANPNIIVIGEYISANIPILHKCLKDGNEWYARPSNILFGTGCPKCNQSKGERKIHSWLNNKHILYESQKSFKDCRDIRPLPFDFYLPDYNKIIEYDGEQHYKPIKHFGGNKTFAQRVKHDNIKNEYCKNKGISLLRIPYYKNIEEELNNFLFI